MGRRGKRDQLRRTCINVVVKTLKKKGLIWTEGREKDRDSKSHVKVQNTSGKRVFERQKS